MRWFIFLGFVYLLQGCTKGVSKENLPYLHGYWEIQKVTLQDGNTKDYTVNTNVDYIEIEGFKGFRKKMRPKFDGTYDTSDDAELFTLIEEDKKFIFHYKNNLSEWKETLLKLSKNSFSVSNEEGIIYDYARFKPINGKE